MNGVSAVVLATGNDTRAVEAGAHAYAARSGRYSALTRREKTADGALAGTLEMPLAVGIVGGATGIHPTARMALDIMGITTVDRLARVAGAVGLVQNFSALRAPATEGIQRGHMALHAKNVAIAAGAEGPEIAAVARERVARKAVRVEVAEEVLSRLRVAPGPRPVRSTLSRSSPVDEVAVFAAATETFSARDINCTVAESLERFRPVLAAAARDGIKVRGYVSCVTDCPYEGPVDPAAVARLTEDLLTLGCYEVALGDTIGRGTPATVAAMLDAVLTVAAPDRLAGHFHDTGGSALANVEVSLARGLRSFDAAAGGLGGCPFAPGAPGNLGTLDLVRRLHELGYDTGVDEARLEAAARLARTTIGRPPGPIRHPRT
jgi:hydroxymethylglutaryl-CoA lyase